MIAFLQTYGFWIILGVLFLLMMRMHSGHGMGGCCGMGGMEHDQQGGRHHHTDGEPKSDDQAGVIPYSEDMRDGYQPYQCRVRDFYAQDNMEGSAYKPAISTQHVHEP